MGFFPSLISAADLQEEMESIVWGDFPDPYSEAVRYIANYWAPRDVQKQVHKWIHDRHVEYIDKCTLMSVRCDMSSPGVMLIYNHYFNIQRRYGKVYSALTD